MSDSETATKWRRVVADWASDRNVRDAVGAVVEKLYYAGVDSEEGLRKLSEEDIQKMGFKLKPSPLRLSVSTTRRSTSKDEETLSVESPRSSISTRAWAAMKRSFRVGAAPSSSSSSSTTAVPATTATTSLNPPKLALDLDQAHAEPSDRSPVAESPIWPGEPDSAGLPLRSDSPGSISTALPSAGETPTSRSSRTLVSAASLPNLPAAASPTAPRRQRVSSPLSMLARRDSLTGASAPPPTSSTPPPHGFETDQPAAAESSPRRHLSVAGTASAPPLLMKEMILKRSASTTSHPNSNSVSENLVYERRGSSVQIDEPPSPSPSAAGETHALHAETTAFAHKLSDEIAGFILSRLHNGSPSLSHLSSSAHPPLPLGGAARARSRFGMFNRAKSKSETLLRGRGGSKDDTYTCLDGLAATNAATGVARGSDIDQILFRLTSARVVAKSNPTSVVTSPADIGGLDSFPVSLPLTAKFRDEEELEIEITASPADLLTGRALVDPNKMAGVLVVPMDGNRLEAVVEWKRSVVSGQAEQRPGRRERRRPTAYLLLLGFLGGVATTLLGIKLTLDAWVMPSEWAVALLVGGAVAVLGFEARRFAALRNDASRLTTRGSPVVEITSASLRESSARSRPVSVVGDAGNDDAFAVHAEAIHALRESVLEYLRANPSEGPGSRASKKRFAVTLKKWNISSETDSDPETRSSVVRKYLDSSRTLLAVLRARKFNVAAASKLLRTLMDIRTAFNLDDANALTSQGFAGEIMLPSFQYMGAEALLKSFAFSNIEEASAYRRSRFMGRDKHGNLIVYQQAGAMDLGAYYREVCRSEPTNLVRFSLFVLELWRREGLAHAETSPEASSQLTVILDLEGFSLSHMIPATHLLPIVREVFPIVTVAYPELFQRLILINTPYKFTIFHRMLKPFISAELLDKMQVHGRVDVAKILSPYVPAEEIPCYLGGQMMGSLEPFQNDPFCRDRVGHPRGTWPSREDELDLERKRSLSDSGNERQSNGSAL